MKFLFRGTSFKYEGNNALKKIPITCTSRNLFLAYLFAKESKKYGEAVILIFREEDVKEDITDGNVFQSDEDEVTLKIKPIEAFDRAIKIVKLPEFLIALKRAGINHEEYAEKSTGNRYKIKKTVPVIVLTKIFNELKINV